MVKSGFFLEGNVNTACLLVLEFKICSLSLFILQVLLMIMSCLHNWRKNISKKFALFFNPSRKKFLKHLVFYWIHLNYKCVFTNETNKLRD